MLCCKPASRCKIDHAVEFVTRDFRRCFDGLPKQTDARQRAKQDCEKLVEPLPELALTSQVGAHERRPPEIAQSENSPAFKLVLKPCQGLLKGRIDAVRFRADAMLRDEAFSGPCYAALYRSYRAAT